MNHKLLLNILVAAGTLPLCAGTWPEVTPEMRPGTRWWWMGSAVDSVNLSRQLQDFARAGIGSVEITPIYGVQGNDANEIPYLSEEWMRMLGITEKIASTQGILTDMNQGTGWPFGGPEVTLSDAACKVTFTVDTVIAGGRPVKSPADASHTDPEPIAICRRDLGNGKEQVTRAFMGRTGQKVKRAAPGGEGLVIDHFDKDAVAKYLYKFDSAFRDSGVPYPHNFFNDSYEVYAANWTPALLEEFRQRRGYDLADKLPELIGLADDGNQTLCDYRETLSELLLENFTEQWAQWAHERGVRVRNQAHGSPANLIDVYAAVDVPEIEGFGLSDFGIKGLRKDSGFTRKNDSDVSMLKYASSAAHITGKPLTSSETFTWLTEHFRTSLSQMKPDVDLMFTCGVNHMFFHGSTYSPAEAAWPGWKFYASVDMSPTNTIWKDAPALMEYITRCQSMLQQGKPDNDFLVYVPIRDMWKRRLFPGEKGLLMGFSIHDMSKLAPDFIKTVMTIDSLGYDCDYISDRYLMSTRYDGEKLVTEGGSAYKGLIIPGSGDLPEALRIHLDSLAGKGADIIFGIDEKRMRSAATPETMRTELGVRAIRRADKDGHIYFIANLTPRDVDAFTKLSTGFSDAVVMNPMTSEIRKAAIRADSILLSLRSGESTIIRTYDHPIENLPEATLYSTGAEYDLTSLPWTLSVKDADGEGDRVFRLDSLKPWTSIGDQNLDEFAGTGTYTTVFDTGNTIGCVPTPDDVWEIDLGDVRESARVRINGTCVGTAWAVPFVVRFENKKEDGNPILRPGKNEVTIEVTNLPANRISALDRKGENWRIFKEINMVDLNYRHTDYSGWKTVSSGLNSGVVMRRLIPDDCPVTPQM